MSSTHYSCQVLMKPEFSWQIFDVLGITESTKNVIKFVCLLFVTECEN